MCDTECGAYGYTEAGPTRISVVLLFAGSISYVFNLVLDIITCVILYSA